MNKLREWQIAPANRLLEILRHGNAALDLSDTGCHLAGTLILMADGSLKPVENIQIGDPIQGWEGEPQFVTALTRGAGHIAKIIPVKGAAWAVNLDHILTLQYTTISSEAGYGKFSGCIIDLKVSDFIKLPEGHKHVLKLFRRGVNSWPEKILAFDPYFLGLMLGDGHITQRRLSLSKPGDFIFKALKMELDKVPGESKITTYWRSPGNPSHNVYGSAFQVWRREFEILDLLGRKSGDKFIPFHYKTGSISQRQKILCGLLDTDGAMTNGGFDFVSKSSRLAEDVAFVARSLGFAAYVKPSEKYCQTGGGGIYFRVSLSGDFSELPFQRHVPRARKQIKSVLHTGFKIELLPTSPFYGFSLSGDGRFLLGDFTVTHNSGKTYVACAVASQIKLPLTVAVIPKIAHTSWQQAAKVFDLPLVTIGYEALRTGRSPCGRWENQPPKIFPTSEFFACESCQCIVDFDAYRPCHCHPAGLHCIKTKRKPWKYGKFIWSEDIKFLIFDEVHRCSGLDSLNADMLIAAKRQGIRVLGLSATAACTPLQMRAFGYVLDLHGLNQNTLIPRKDFSDSIASFAPIKMLPTFYQWAARHDCRPDPVYRGLRWFAGAERQAKIMAEIHSKLIPDKGVRVRTQDIPDFPDRIITAELYDLEKDYEIRKLYNEMESALDALSKREAEDAASEHPLTKILRARQRIELLKVPIFVEVAQDDLAKGNSVAIFVNFRQTIDELRRRLQTNCVVDGSPDGVDNRDWSINNFQSNGSKIIILNSAAGGVNISLQDLHGGHPRVGLVSPPTSAVQFKQLCGRLPRAGGKSTAVYKVILAARTVEIKIKKVIDIKGQNIDILNDADLQPERE